MAREYISPSTREQSNGYTEKTSQSDQRKRKKVVAAKGSKVRKGGRPTLRTKSKQIVEKPSSKTKNINVEKLLQENAELKKKNVYLAKTCNQIKQLVKMKDEEIMEYKNEILALNTETSMLRSELDTYEAEDGAFVQQQKAIKECMNKTMDHVINLNNA
jgi:chromosome segregation ATPase